MPFFCSQDEFRLQFYIQSSCFFRLLLALTLSQIFLVFFLTLVVLKRIGQVFCRLTLSWTSPDVFLMISPGVCFGEDDHRGEVLFPSYRIKGVCYQHESSQLRLTWVSSLRQCLSGFSPAKLLSPPQHTRSHHVHLPLQKQTVMPVVSLSHLSAFSLKIIDTIS